FFDLVFLMGRNIAPDMTYLRQKLNIDTPEDLKARLLNRCHALDMNAMAADVAPFLLNPADEKKVRWFAEYLEGYAF
ncbi:MAG: hypothetical protein ACKOW8_14945, partial [Flavobacteriales bacterium]